MPTRHTIAPGTLLGPDKAAAERYARAHRNRREYQARKERTIRRVVFNLWVIVAAVGGFGFACLMHGAG